ncbi:MAG: putative methyltransferase [Candidatus Hydrothermarchaeota archaeon]|nr:MAG: putative methyltransferase [Candidatus Hydrothermarchaeota archaeon]
MKKCRELVLRSLSEREKSFWELIDENEYDIKTVIATINELLGKEIEFNEKEKKFRIKEPLNYTYINLRCKHCNGRGYSKDYFEDVLNKFVEITKERPLPIADYDQGFIIPTDLALKASFMYQRGDIVNKEILVLGDDDLYSIFLGLTKLPKRVVVLDIDERIIDFVNKVAENENLRIEAIKQDLSKGLPEGIGKFDAFVSEPPESFLGFKIFLDRGIKSLKGIGSSGYFGLTRLESSWAKWRWIEKFIIDNDFAITDIIRDFSIYPERENKWEDFYNHYKMMKKIKVNVGLPDIDWYKSALIRIEKVERIKEDWSDLYMDEETLATPKPFEGG